jgi:hypothetical protein
VTLRHGSDFAPFTLPPFCHRLSDGPRTTRYVCLGRPDLRRPHSPWRYVEQMGEAHRLETDALRLTIVARARHRAFTVLELLVEPQPRP